MYVLEKSKRQIFFNLIFKISLSLAGMGKIVHLVTLVSFGGFKKFAVGSFSLYLFL